MTFPDRLSDFIGIGPLGQVTIEPVPEAERMRYRFWRATSVAKLALVFATTGPRMNLGDGCTIHFFDNNDSWSAYDDAVKWADYLIHTQIKPSDIRALERLTGRLLTKQHLPRLVFALDEQFNDERLPVCLHPNSPGVELNRPVGLADIDPYSRALLGELLEGVA